MFGFCIVVPYVRWQNKLRVYTRVQYRYVGLYYNAYGPTSIFCRRARDYAFFVHVRGQMHVVSCVLCFVCAVFCHRLRGSASTVLTATGQVNGRWRILTPHRIEIHEPIATKFRTIDYLRERTPWTKFGTNPSIGDFWAYGWKRFCAFFIYLYLFLRLAYRSDRLMHFYAR